MRAVSLLPVALALAGVGLSLSQPAPRSYSALGADFTSAVEVGKPKGTTVAPAAGTLTAMHWETNTAGTGSGTFTLAAQVNEADVCTLVLGCTSTASANAECSTSVVAGDDVHVTIAASSCDTLPLGVSSLWMRLAQ